MSSNTAQWAALPNLSSLAPTAVTDALSSISGVLDKANDVLNFIENLLGVVEKLLVSPGDILSTFLDSYLKAIIQVIQDSLSLGGGLICIHPFNRMNRRYTANLFPDPWKILVPVMTPQEAFNELYASFNNTADPYRPQWTNDTIVTGLGFLITAPDPTGFLNVISALGQLIDIKEFNDVITHYKKSVTQWAQDTEKQTGKSLALAPFDITGITDLKYKETTTTTPGGKVTTKTVLVGNNPLPRLHWWGLSISNFTILRQITSTFEYAITALSNLIKTNDKAIAEIITALLNKVKALQNLVQVVFNAIETLLISLNSTGLYYFEIPQGAGGVSYIKTAIQQSLSAPSSTGAKEVKNLLNTSNFSMLFFMGASTGVNLDAWDKLFKNAFNSVSAEITSIENSFANISYAVLPEFKGAVFNFGETITLRVSSAESTAQHPLYYTYSMSDNKGNVVSSFTNTNILSNAARVNSSAFNVTFIKPTTVQDSNAVGIIPYSVTINIFDGLTINQTYTASFSVTDTVTKLNTSIRSGAPLTLTSATSATAAIVNTTTPSGGYPLEKVYISPGSTVSLGTSISSFATNLALQYNDGVSTLIIPIQNNLGYNIVDISAPPIPGSFRFLTFPAKICFNFPGIIKYAVAGSSNFIYVTLPACIVVQNNTTYDYYLYTAATGWSGLLSFSVITQANEGAQVC